MDEPGAGSRTARPLSPHLQIYWPTINMVMSILHRLTGAALYAGTLLFAAYVVAAAMGPETFAYVAGLYDSLLGRVVLFGYTWALFHHMLGGIRHLVWDTGHGFDLATVGKLCWATIAGSLMLTAGVWLAGGSRLFW